MASSSSLVSPPSSLPRNWKHHVFPSFHGADVRVALLSHILEKFRSKGISPFIDNNIERGKSICPELIGAIRGSRIAIVLLSEKYASSTWCLNELVEIIKCRQELGQTVMALFYKVDPTHVKKQTGDFGKFFRQTCKGKTKEDIRRWEHALTEVAQIAGYHSGNWNNEAEMIEEISTDVSNKLNNSTPSSDFDGLVGMESHMRKMRPLLQLELEEVRVIGILGPPGIGKTTIARSLFNRHSGDFQLSVFMGNIKRKYAKPACSDDYSVKLYLQKKFLSKLIKEKGLKVPHLGVVQDRLKDKKVLVVLDDVDRLVQLEAMAKETCWFGPWSRIIITTQDQKLLKASGIKHIYKVGLPSTDKALQMFSMYAFGQKEPEAGFMELASEVTRLAGALPLGLRIMGSYFRGLSKLDWKKALRKLMIRLDGDIESILMFSYDALCDEDKNLFLHIACLFDRESVDVAEGCLANSFSDVTLGLRVLAEKSLISIDSGAIEMHNLLVQLGREIVRKQSSSEPGKRQFLDDEKDIVEVLSDDEAGSSSVIGIDLWFSEEDTTRTSERAFGRLSNLRFLSIDGHGDGPNPRGFGLPCFPSSFHPKFLVKLHMRNSKLEKLWEEIQPLSNLKWMDLSGSESLKELPDLSTATNLCKLELSYCSNLVELPSSLGNAVNLEYLNLGHCSNLVGIPSSIGNAINLKYLYLMFCSSLVKLPSSIGNAINLQKLDLSCCSSLVEIPSSITTMVTNLKSFDFYGCSSLVELPVNVETAIDPQYVDLSNCSSLVKLPSSIGNAINPQYLSLSHCSSLVELPSSIGNANNLKYLDLMFCSSLVELHSSIGNAVNLEELNLGHCSNLVELPSSMRNLCRLSKLELEKCSKLEVNLDNINLESLQELNLSDCSLLKSYREACTSIEDPRLSGAATKEAPSSMRRQELGPWTGRRSRLRRLVLSGMQKLVSLHQLPDSLVELEADNCESLERLDCSFGSQDIRLSFINCFKLNQEARDLIIQTPTNKYAVLPGGEVPVCFPHRSPGSSLTVKLNQMPLGASTKFKACIVFAGKDEENFKHCVQAYVSCSITSKQNALTACYQTIEPVFPEHLYTFEVEAEEVTSTELVFEFNLGSWDFIETLEIKECGVLRQT